MSIKLKKKMVQETRKGAAKWRENCGHALFHSTKNDVDDYESNRAASEPSAVLSSLQGVAYDI